MFEIREMSSRSRDIPLPVWYRVIVCIAYCSGCPLLLSTLCLSSSLWSLFVVVFFLSYLGYKPSCFCDDLSHHSYFEVDYCYDCNFSIQFVAIGVCIAYNMDNNSWYVKIMKRTSRCNVYTSKYYFFLCLRSNTAKYANPMMCRLE
jgi:hypothetical protein